MKWSLHKASAEFGVTRETIRRGLAAYGVDPKKEYTTREIHMAIAGDVKAATARDRMASAIARERENRIAEGEIITLTDNQKWQEKVLLPIRQRLIALPGSMAQRCNPADPSFAETALDAWVKESMPLLRSEIRKAAKSKR
jgi:hypothetical protein